MTITAMSDLKIGHQSFLQYWEHATGTKDPEFRYYSSKYFHKTSTESVAVKVIDNSIRGRTVVLTDEEIQNSEGFIIAFSLVSDTFKNDV